MSSGSAPPHGRYAVAVAVVVATGCGDARPGVPDPDADDASAPAVVELRAPANGDLESVGIQGVLVIDGPCLYLDGPAGRRAVVAWPHGTEWDGAAGAVRRPGGVGPHDDAAFTLRDGDFLRATGIVLAPSAAAAEIATGSHDALDDCLERDVAVLRAHVAVADPQTWVPPTT